MIAHREPSTESGDDAGDAHGQEGGQGARGHTHGLVDRSIVRSRKGVKAVSIGLAVLAITSGLQLAVFVLFSGSVALLADLIHNLGDALTAIPLGIAFFLRSARAEKVAGLAVVLAIFISACVALYETIVRFIHPQHLTHLWVLAAAGALGFLGNEIAARVRLRAGKRLAGLLPRRRLRKLRVRSWPEGRTPEHQPRPGCDAGRAIHEIGHAGGLWHEQSREDRGTYIRIESSHIQAGKEHNFDQHITDGDDVGGYDYGSIMHYGLTDFSKDGQPTMTALKPIPAGVTVGQRTGLSAGDQAAVRAMYPTIAWFSMGGSWPGAPATFSLLFESGAHWLC